MEQLGNFTSTNKALGQKSQVLQVPTELQKVKHCYPRYETPGGLRVEIAEKNRND